MKTILVVGGAGYIGSHMVKCLKRAGHAPVVLDNLVCGYREAVQGAELIEGDAGDAALLDKLFSTRKFDAVMHFASFIQVGESVSNPGLYYDNNVARSITLLNALVKHKINYFVFSSTAAIFGEPAYLPIDKHHPKNPINPYGKSKLMVEMMLEDYAEAHGLHFGCLRYFNAAGADPDGTLGECHEPETHLIPLVLQAANGRRAHIKVFGTDYPTEDGTCIRDYIHVTDLCDAHLKLLNYMWNGGTERFFNIGTRSGYSVLDVIQTAELVTGKRIPIQYEPRRHGDPMTLIAFGNSARTVLEWTPKYSDLKTIITHAWEWEKKLATGKPFG